MEYFIEQAKIVLPVLGVNIFRSPRARSVVPTAEPVDARTGFAGVRDDDSRSPASPPPRKRSTASSRCSKVRARDLDWTGVDGTSYNRLREEARERRHACAVTVTDRRCASLETHVFASPSAAAAIVARPHANGRTEWMVQGTRRTYGQWQTEGVEEAMKRRAAA